MKKILAVALLLLAVPPASAQDDARVYGIFDPSTRDAYPKQDAIAIWDNLDPGWSGDITDGAGAFESWQGSSGGCTNCPVGFICSCTATSDMTQEGSVVFNGSNAVKVVTDAGSNLVFFSYRFNLEANSYYQIYFRVRGATGVEDAKFRLGNTSHTEDYNFTTDAWGGAYEALMTNMPATWTRWNLFINVGPVAKTNYEFRITRNGASQTWYVDDFKIIKLRGTSTASSPGNFTLAPTVTSDPVYAGSASIKTIAGQLSKRGIWADGAEYMVMASDVDSMDGVGTGNLSVCVEYQEDSIIVNTIISSKATNAGRGWLVYSSGANLAGYISKDGGAVNVSTQQVATNHLTPNAGCFTYTRITDGTSRLAVHSNHNTTVTNAAAVAPIFNSPGPLSVFNRSDASGAYWNGSVSRLGVYSQALTEEGMSRWVSPYFPRGGETTGMYASYCSQAASHAVCDANKCTDGTTNRCMPDSQWLPMFNQQSELAPNNSFETNTNTPEDPAFTGYTLTESAGDGTAEITDYQAEARHGAHAARIKLTGTTSYAYMSSTCLPAAPLTTYFAYASTKLLSGAPYFYLSVLEYSDAACTMNLVSNSIVHGAGSSTSWTTQQGSAFTTAATTNFVKISFGKHMEAAMPGFDLLVDNLSLKAASYYTPWVHNAAAGPTVYNARDYRVHNPLSDQKRNGRYAYQDGFCAGMWVWTDWVGNDSAQYYLGEIPGTAGNSNRFIWYKTAANNGNFRVYDSAGADTIKAIALTGVSWPAGWKYLEGCSSNTGTTAARHYVDGVWYSWAASSGAGTNIQNGNNVTLHIGESVGGTSQMNGFIGAFVIGPYQPIFPRYGFNRKPTQNPR